ncbi:MAG: hypothetical protein ACR2QF_06150 [Geminicoccaceae bacterium]
MAIDTPVVVGSVSISGNPYPVFGDQDRAIEYLNASLTGDTFVEADFTVQQQSLVTAYRWLNRQNWKEGFPVPSDGLVPLGIEFAQYELAVVLIDDPEAFTQKSTGSNERVLQAGPARIEFFSRTDGGSAAFSGEGVFPPQALDLIQDYLASKSSIITPVVGGLDNKSNVLDVDQFGLNEPL